MKEHVIRHGEITLNIAYSAFQSRVTLRGIVVEISSDIKEALGECFPEFVPKIIACPLCRFVHLASESFIIPTAPRKADNGKRIRKQFLTAELVKGRN